MFWFIYCERTGGIRSLNNWWTTTPSPVKVLVDLHGMCSSHFTENLNSMLFRNTLQLKYNRELRNHGSTKNKWLLLKHFNKRNRLFKFSQPYCRWIFSCSILFTMYSIKQKMKRYAFLPCKKRKKNSNLYNIIQCILRWCGPKKLF